MDSLHVDCDTCTARGPACGDCLVSVLLGTPTSGVDLNREERIALGALAASGLVPPLRLVADEAVARSLPQPTPFQDYA